MNTAKTVTLTATLRGTHGKGPARTLRREGKVPAILYSKQQTPISIAIPLKDVTREYNLGRFRSRLVNIALDDGKTIQALPKELQFHPVTDAIEHVDFLKVDAGSSLHVMVPLRIRGREKSVGLKRGGALNVVRHEIEFICKSDSIPSYVETSIQNLNIGESVHINDIALPDGVHPAIERNFTVLTITGRGGKADAEDEAADAAAAEAASTESADKTAAEGDAKEAAPVVDKEKK